MWTNSLVFGGWLALFGAAPAWATEHEVETYGPLLEQCYAEAQTVAKPGCVGAASKACMDDQDGGHTTFGMASCLHAEAAVWDRFLNAEYKALMAVSVAMDADEGPDFADFANRADTLRAAQRAWIGYRDASCAHAYAQWGSGSMRHIAGTDCMLQMTADRTIELIGLREMFE